ncbi:uncharacterized protein ColSpa_10287 [Colletotrichum spaethianum]|uniref:TLC domain-containing protein n=1 Tax=Colletotrichum spaethianum TaxID=700344 RepID=A0AA37PD56_9PEZI|nr:uncharacterized protein ColSpa_10287 [Colletotrichum spaethianum]GKT50106.1 hypothetical protein ColSpa_10287 [Colletotrichum spaethianum]
MFLVNCALILMGLVVYQLLNRCLHKTVKHFNPDFYAELELDRYHKLAPYFVFPLGILLTLFTTPICLLAYHETPSATDTFGLDRPFTANGKVCLSSRAALWISEMPLLSYSPEYIAHHILSLGSLVLVMISKSPRQPIYLIYAGLVTELFSDTVALLRLHGRNAANSAPFRRAMLANVLSMISLRIIPVIAYTATMPETRPYYAGGIALYCFYLARLTFLQLGTLGYHKMRLGRAGIAAQSDKNSAKSKSA